MAVTYIGDLRAVDFLSNFDSETRAQIIEFGKRISSKDLAADVYLIMARKAICFVDLLLQFKLKAKYKRRLDTNVQAAFILILYTFRHIFNIKISI